MTSRATDEAVLAARVELAEKDLVDVGQNSPIDVLSKPLGSGHVAG